MASADCTPSETRDELRDVLTEFQALLSKLYDVVSWENKKQKTQLAHLTRLSSTILDVQKNRGKVEVAVSIGDAEFSPTLLLPELEESERLLGRCKELKHKFHGNTDASHSLVGGRLSQVQAQTAKANRPIPLQHRRSTSHTLNQRDERYTKNSLPPKYSVISQSNLQQLSELLKQKEVPSGKQMPEDKCRSSEVSLQQLLEQNRALETKLRLSLEKEPPQTSTLFLERMNSSVCQDCLLILQKDMADCSAEDEAARCSLLPKVQFPQFYCQVHHFVRNSILPLLDKCSITQGVPKSSLQLLHSLVQTGVSEQDQESNH